MGLLHVLSELPQVAKRPEEVLLSLNMTYITRLNKNAYNHITSTNQKTGEPIMNESEEIPLTDYQALAEFRYQIRRFLRFSEQMARAAGIEPQQHQLLLAVKGLPEG